MFNHPDIDKPIMIAFILVEGFSLLPFISATEPLRMANRIANKELFKRAYFSEKGEAVLAGNGIEIQTVGSVKDLHEYPNLFITGGFEPLVKTPRWLIDILKSRSRSGAMIGALGTGTYHVARAGLLDGKKATVHWEYAASFAEEFPRTQVTSSLYEISTNRITCSGGIAAMDMMTHLISQHTNPLLATAVSDTFIHGRVRTARDVQKVLIPGDGEHTPLELRAAISIMQRRNDSRINIHEIARELGVSSRHLSRLFQRHVGKSPLAFANQLRLQRAQSYVLHSNLGFQELAELTGFTSSSAFSRAYKQNFGIAPYSHRATTIANR